MTRTNLCDIHISFKSDILPGRGMGWRGDGLADLGGYSKGAGAASG